MIRTIYIRIFGVFIIVGFVSMGFQNCSDMKFRSLAEQGNTCSDDLDHVCHESTLAIQKIQPAVAVRGISCLMCHAEIRANVITDFGYGSSWYWGGSNATVNGESWFNNYVNTWQSAHSIIGSVIVPDQNVPTSIQNSVSQFQSNPAMKIKEFMNTPYDAPGNWDGNTPEEGKVEMTFRVTPINNNDKVIAKSEIVIQAPSEEDIIALAPELWATLDASRVKRFGSNAPTQFVVRENSSATYTMNDETTELQCAKSNIIVKGTLYLRNLKVDAAGGCRLYVSGSVFIEGPIVYATTGTDQNLQITSANGIFMGIGLNNLERRLLKPIHVRGLQISGTRPYSERANQAYLEGTIINALDKLIDAKKDEDSPRLSIDYTGLLLNAPIIHSRYFGLFKGTVIAEAALFSLGQFHFEFDQVFTRVNAFPLLKKPILVVK
ncbi:MAG: hypothetical protein A2Z20_12710 [Bdellovibrionales bacterium RBG_16_40_8]|nr:MAG: hypothetical protein A2Z20_12710 [Bdellovibrionales bacterium RBG_16_40_8]